MLKITSEYRVFPSVVDQIVLPLFVNILQSSKSERERLCNFSFILNRYEQRNTCNHMVFSIYLDMSVLYVKGYGALRDSFLKCFFFKIDTSHICIILTIWGILCCIFCTFCKYIVLRIVYLPPNFKFYAI